MISQRTILEIKSRINIVDRIGASVKLKKQGQNHIGLCPFHNEKTPSFTVSASKEMFKCFGCGESGDIISFVMKNEKCDYVEAVQKLAAECGVSIEEEVTRKQYVKPIPRLETVSKKTIDFFEGRNISNNTIIRFKITESREWMPQFEKEVPVMCFNYFIGEELVNIKFRGPQKSFKLAKDAKLIFFNLNDLQGEEECIITEGEIDCMSWHESQIYNSCSVPNGAAAKGELKLEYLDNCWKYFTDKKKIILATDNDETGKRLAEELARRLGKERCWTVTYPEGCKDTNEVLMKYGPDEVRRMRDTAKPWPVEGIDTLDEMFPTVVQFFEQGYPPGAKAGIRIAGSLPSPKDFDEHISFVGGQLTTITGIPGSGKDEFANLLMAKLAMLHQWSWGIIQFEEPNEVTVSKLMEKISGKSFAFRKDRDHRMSEREFEQAISIVDKYFYFVNTNEVEVTMDGLITLIDQMVLRYGIKGILLNPWNWIDHKKTDAQSETEYVSETLTKLIVCLKRNDLHGFLMAHPTKIKKNEKTGKYNVVTLYDISGSAHFFNKTHNGISVYRDFETGIVDVYIQKVKHSWLGKVGFCTFTFDTFTRQYTQVA